MAAPTASLRWANVLVRHLMASLLAAALVYLFHDPFGDSSGRDLWNRSLARASVVLLGATLLIGPLARLWPRFAPALRLRREVGIWSAVAALAHVVLVLEEWAYWRLRSFWVAISDEAFVIIDWPLVAANAIGLAAIALALVLLATSNDFAQRKLGARWKTVQSTSSLYFLLVVLHTSYFLYMRSARGPSTPFDAPLTAFRAQFALLVAIVVALRVADAWARRARPT